MHVHLGLVHAISVFLSVIIIGFFWRLAASYYKEYPIGQAMAFIY